MKPGKYKLKDINCGHVFRFQYDIDNCVDAEFVTTTHYVYGKLMCRLIRLNSNYVRDFDENGELWLEDCQVGLDYKKHLRNIVKTENS